jgi:hypothetical protein
VDTTHGAAFALVTIRVCVGWLFGRLGFGRLSESWVVVCGSGGGLRVGW